MAKKKKGFRRASEESRKHEAGESKAMERKEDAQAKRKPKGKDRPEYAGDKKD